MSYLGLNSGYNKRLFRDCLTKTQVRANSKEKVYGLRPAQCSQVKGMVEITSRLELKPE